MLINKSLVTNSLSLLEDKLRTYVAKYDDVILLGDLNKDYLSNDQSITNLFRTYNIQNHVRAPTHITTNSATCIDYMASCLSGKLLGISQIGYPNFSKHDILFCCLDYSIRPASPLVKTFRNYNQFNMDNIAYYLNQIDWNPYFLLINPNDILQFLVEKLSEVHDVIFPLRNHTHSNTVCPWLNDYVKTLMMDRDMAYSFILFKKLRNKSRSAFRDAKNAFINSYIPANLPSNVLWKRLENIGLKSSKKSQPVEFSPDTVNEHFINSVNSNLNICPTNFLFI